MRGNPWGNFLEIVKNIKLDKLIIKGGKVGIGTNTPNNRLSVVGTGNSTAAEGIASFFNSNNNEINVYKEPPAISYLRKIL